MQIFQSNLQPKNPKNSWNSKEKKKTFTYKNIASKISTIEVLSATQ